MPSKLWRANSPGRGAWAEVKTLAIGEVAAPVREKGEWLVHTQAVSYFSRLADHHTFERLALVETHRRGVETAGQVGAVLDGAEWLQGFVNFHRPDAVRTRSVDFPHGAEYIGKMGQALYGEGTPESQAWLIPRLHRLKHDGPREVLADLRALTLAHPDLPEWADPLAYLAKREAQMQYPTFQAAGWPIGSGAVESGNRVRVVVEARLKGSGMHWARSHVDPMLALRNIVCNDRGEEAWPQSVVYLRQRDAARRAERQRKRCEARAAAALDRPTLAEPALPTLPVATELPCRPESPPARLAVASKPEGPRRPAPNHPWRRMPIGRAQYQPAHPREVAKL